MVVATKQTMSNASSQVPLWIRTWTFVSSLVVIWIDYFYGLPAFNSQDGFTGAQAFMNGIETLLNFTYLGLLKNDHVSVGQANLVGFSAALMTLSKTILYWLIEPFSGYQHIGHNSVKDLIILWIIPNGLWIVVPAAIVYTLGKDLFHRLNAANSKQE
ncbi:hypothetical protein HMPREF1544_01186 [Mucor circinelloides 1006PhL]|uniref:EXPERA domain-containing protein n=1 Tax=Mucor circinelloides f. circinelloides (strain 1006PhL) TaxID=1220926 RepID=S2JTZ8_MUCC1|nr:hypothetical protein HMPREF1544_01186 [Mucor circinelloides 1006PhL]